MSGYAGEDYSEAEEYKDRRDSSKEKKSLHDEKGRFKKGHKGLVPYKKQHLTRQAFMQLADDKLLRAIPKVVEMVIKKALEGNLHAAKLIFERLIPAQRPTSHTGSYGGGIQIVVQGGSTTDIKKTFDVTDVEDVNNKEEN